MFSLFGNLLGSKPRRRARAPWLPLGGVRCLVFGVRARHAELGHRSHSATGGRLSRTARRRIVFGLSYAFLGGVGVSMIFPFFWMFLTSVKTPAEDVLDPAEWWPKIPWRLGKVDIRDWPRFCRKLITGGESESPGPARRVWQLIDRRSRWTFVAVSKKASPSRRQKMSARHMILDSEKGIILTALNGVLQRHDFYTQKDFKQVALSGQAQRLLKGREDDPQIRYANRLVLDAAFPDDIVPTHRFHWENYRTVIVETHFARVLLNSVFVSVTVTLGLVFTSSLAAFAFARLNFVGRDRIFLSYLATLMIPSAVTMIPVFILIRQLGWANTYRALIIPSMFSAYGTFMLRQFFMSLPRDLEEAALLDGCSIWGIYRHVVLPLSKPALAALTILTFMGVWRGFMWPLIVTHTRDMYTLPVALAAFREMYGVRWTLMMAGSVIMIVPMLVVFVLGQRYFIEGIKLGAIKG